jgi:transposase
LTADHDAAVQMIDTSIVRVHQHGACIAANGELLMGRSRGGLTTRIHAVVDTGGLPVRLALSTGEAHDNRLVLTLLSGLKSGAMLLADQGFDADWIRALVSQHGAWANIPPKRNRTEPIYFSRHLYRARNSGAILEARRIISKAHALEYRDGLIIALLAPIPLRSRPLVALRIGKQLVKAGDLWALDIPAADTKTRRRLDYPISKELCERINLYLDWFRHRIPGADKHTGLWVSNK